MDRNILQNLLSWAKNEHRLPIILRGARQVGKSYIVQHLGQKHFESFVEINFEFLPEYKNCFNSLDPKEIIKQITLIAGKPIIPGKTLLFLDEIQDCPRAIMALRYFKENMPELHVISAGSLLEFALNKEAFKMPVGRVQFMHMYPLSFKEFLSAIGETQFREYIESLNLSEKINISVHEKGLKLLREYFFIGGMPAAINAYLKNHSFIDVQQMQSVILSTYQNDFAKYASGSQLELMSELFPKTAQHATEQFKYSKVMPDILSRDIKSAMGKFAQANIIKHIYASAANGLPFSKTVNKRKFKILFLDTGLMNRQLHVSPEVFFNENIMMLHSGALAEHFVGQELLLLQDLTMPDGLYFWARDKANSNAEIDYVINANNKIVPIEVKSGKLGKLKSLNMFLDMHPTTTGIKLSQAEMFENHRVLSLPLYLVSELKRLISL